MDKIIKQILSNKKTKKLVISAVAIVITAVLVFLNVEVTETLTSAEEVSKFIESQTN